MQQPSRALLRALCARGLGACHASTLQQQQQQHAASLAAAATLSYSSSSSSAATSGLRWVFLGPPGVGKGTYASRIAAALCVPHIAAGDLVRAEIKSGSGLGQQMAALVNKGQLLPDEVVIEVRGGAGGVAVVGGWMDGWDWRDWLIADAAGRGSNARHAHVDGEAVAG
jgi:hypothetical protein